jgi:hypothetical protein
MVKISSRNPPEIHTILEFGGKIEPGENTLFPSSFEPAGEIPWYP